MIKKLIPLFLFVFVSSMGWAQVNPTTALLGSWSGKLSVGPTSLTLVLAKGEGVKEAKRPQTPKQPYPYETEEVTFHNEKDGATLVGTLTWPVNYDKKQKPTAVLLVSGSGQQNRDEELMNQFRSYFYL